MNKNFRVIGLVMGLIMMINTASASLLIEPHVAYNISGSGETDVGGHREYDENGPQFGARLGYQSFGFMGGLDFTHSTFDLETKAGGATATTPMDRNEWGVFVGYNLPILVRAWAAYYFTNKTEADNNTGFKGHTIELGVGFTALPFLSLNAMYRMVTYDEGYSGSTTANLTDDINIHEFVLGVSLPLNL